MKKIVIFGGGTGTSTLLRGLKKYPIDLSVIVSSWDDGGSNGRLRKEMKAFPYSDIRQCLAALAKDGYWKKFFEFRFAEGELAGHTAANLLMAELQQTTKSVTEPIEIAKKLLDVKARIYPATLTPAVLSAVLESGRAITGEHLIDSPQSGKFSRIKKLKLLSGKKNPAAIKAVQKADILIFGPGDLHTSVLPNLLAPGLATAVKKSRAKKVFVGNLMTKDGQTNGFKASDFVKEMLKYVPELDYAIFNKLPPPQKLVGKYRHYKSKMVELDWQGLKDTGVKIILENLLVSKEIKTVKGDILKRSFLRHNSQKLAKLIYQMGNL